MKTITLEEHFITPKFMQGPGRELVERVQGNQDTVSACADLRPLGRTTGGPGRSPDRRHGCRRH